MSDGVLLICRCVSAACESGPRRGGMEEFGSPAVRNFAAVAPTL